MSLNASLIPLTQIQATDIHFPICSHLAQAVPSAHTNTHILRGFVINSYCFYRQLQIYNLLYIFKKIMSQFSL